MRSNRFNALVILISMPLITNAAEHTAKPDEALVGRYEANQKQLDAKLSECKAKADIAAVLADISCMSAQEVINKRQRKMVTSKCSGADTFVYVPPGLSAKEKESYLAKHAPSEKVLQACGQSKDVWLQGYMKSGAAK